MSQAITTHSADEMRTFGQELSATLAPGTLITLQGELGAGKTTLAQGILRGLGAAGPYVSPTFVLMKQYDLVAPSQTGIARVYHCDAYRIDKEADLAALGFAEWCADPEGLVLLEWPERVAGILPEKRTTIALTAESADTRRLTLTEPH